MILGVKDLGGVLKASGVDFGQGNFLGMFGKQI
jgi:hypothetical protein